MDCATCGAKGQDTADSRFCTSCGVALAPAFDHLLGQTVGGRFRVTHLIAEGGMGRVYAAEQRMGTTLRKVAIKTLLSDFAKSEPQVQRFLAECSVVAELEHPNTIKFYDWGKTDAGDLFIAMEFVAGESLADVIRREQRLPPERVDVIIGQICGSLQEAHDKGIVHRDVKPENILLTSPTGEDDFVKVLDFGIAKREGQDIPKLTPLGLVLGSPAYMSPEQFSPGALDGRSDVYSLSIMAFEALTGFQPFSGTELLDWPSLHRHGQPLSFEATGVDVPHNMRRAIQRGLAKRAADRHASMRDFFMDFTIGAPRRSSLGSSRPMAADEAVTVMRASQQPSARPSSGRKTQSASPAPAPSGAPSGGTTPLSQASQIPATISKPPVSYEASAPPPPVVVPKAPRMPSALVPPTEPMLPIPPDPGSPSAVPGGVAATQRPMRSERPVPATVREPVPATLREPRGRRIWIPVVVVLLLAVVAAGVLAVVFARPRWLPLDLAPQRPAATGKRR